MLEKKNELLYVLNILQVRQLLYIKKRWTAKYVTEKKKARRKKKNRRRSYIPQFLL